MQLNDENKIAFKIAHLSMVQGIINRMSSFSANAKTFTITILAGLAAISLQIDKVQLGFIAILSTTVLAIIDVYYMTLELRFRALYECIEARDLDLSDDLSISPVKRPGDIPRALKSWPTRLFYLPVFAACIVFIGYGLTHDWWTTSQELLGASPARAEQDSGTDSRTAFAKENTRRIAEPATKDDRLVK